MIENSLEGFIAVRDILLLAPAEEIVAMFNTEELQDYLLENINLLLNFDSHCLFLCYPSFIVEERLACGWR